MHARELLQALLLSVALLMPQELGASGEGALTGQARERGERTRCAGGERAVMVMVVVVGNLCLWVLLLAQKLATGLQTTMAA